MRVSYGKLVRDHVPEIIAADGRVAITRTLDDGEYRAALLAKLVEEAAEARNAPADELPDELADVTEVLLALIEELGMTWPDLARLADRKRDERGGFAGRVFLDYVE